MAPQPPQADQLVDRFGRPVRKLRISVTDRCDLRCFYCMPAEGLPWKRRDELLTYEEIVRLGRIFVGFGVRKLRLTGGEPLVRADLPELVAMLRRELPEVADLSMTTNGVLLDRMAQPLKDAGLDRINVSLDTLDPQVFAEVTRRDAFERVVKGLDAACALFPGKVRINAVALKDRTEAELDAFCELARRRGVVVRFIEYMPLDADGNWVREGVLTGATLRARVGERHGLEPSNADDPSAPAREYRFADGAPGGVGFIDSVSEPFCDRCDRVRLTADGKLRTCLFSVAETDLRTPMRDGASDEELRQALRDAVWAKEAGHRIDKPDWVPASRSMSEIGG